MAVNSCGHESTRGITLLRGAAAAGPFTEIGAIEVMPELSPTAETADCTDPYGAGDAGWVTEFKTGQFNGNDASFTVNWISGNATHDLLEADFLSDSVIYLQVAYADVNATKRTFPALVKGVSHPLPANGGKVQMAFTTKVNGKILKTST